MKITQANKGPLIVKTGFDNYDYCLNTYVGCRFGCAYCYVRFFIKDKKEPWGQFIRTRDHVVDRLAKEITRLPIVKMAKGVVKWMGPDLKDARIVMGTMTDPYQPIEKKLLLTRSALEILEANPPKKVGIFTRSPIAARDIDIFKRLPDMHIHITVSPLPQDIKRMLEPVSVTMKAGLRLVEKMKNAGINTSVNVAPALPFVSEQFTQFMADELARLKVNEFFVDPMQPYAQSLEKVRECLKGHPKADAIINLMSDKPKYEAWKDQFHKDWIKAWDQSKSPNTLAIACDHERGIRKNMADA